MKTKDSYRNITRFTYDNTAFQGWRLAICRKNKHFTCYFSDKQYGSEEEALRAAISMRDEIFHELTKNPLNPQAIFDQVKAKKAPKAYPAGLKPKKTPPSSD